MNTELAKTENKTGAMALMAERLSVDPTKLTSTLKSTVFKNATNEELLALVVTANEYRLNPILKEMHAFPQKGGGIVPVVGIDGWLKIINRQKNFDGLSVKISKDGSEATCTIHLKDRNHPIEVTEFLEECSRPTEPWKTMPRRMLRHKAIMQAGRVAFGISGLHDEDEARDIEGKSELKNVTPDSPSAFDSFKGESADPGAAEEVQIVTEENIDAPKKAKTKVTKRAVPERIPLPVDWLESLKEQLLDAEISEKAFMAAVLEIYPDCPAKGLKDLTVEEVKVAKSKLKISEK